MTVERPFPTLAEETAALAAGYSRVAGVDEAGRGCLAGPVAAAAVILPLDSPEKLQTIEGVRDSKLLLPKAREQLEERILEIAVAVGFGLASVEEINALGIAPASRLAMKRAVAAMPVEPDFLLIDAFHLPEIPIPQKPVIHGDALCVSIAAASIIAKVGRDRVMVELDGQYPGYGLSNHKGYSTKEHQEAIRTLGVCTIHRANFKRVHDILYPPEYEESEVEE